MGGAGYSPGNSSNGRPKVSVFCNLGGQPSARRPELPTCSWLWSCPAQKALPQSRRGVLFAKGGNRQEFPGSQLVPLLTASLFPITQRSTQAGSRKHRKHLPQLPSHTPPRFTIEFRDLQNYRLVEPSELPVFYFPFPKKDKKEACSPNSTPFGNEAYLKTALLVMSQMICKAHSWHSPEWGSIKISILGNVKEISVETNHILRGQKDPPEPRSPEGRWSIAELNLTPGGSLNGPLALPLYLLM